VRAASEEDGPPLSAEVQGERRLPIAGGLRRPADQRRLCAASIGVCRHGRSSCRRSSAPFLVALQKAADAGRADHFMTAGQLEIKQFIIPGWDSTSGSMRRYPGHTRVNHTKYIVTDRRINIGTSNMTWDYFASTAGSSFNADHHTLVRTLQSVFDRDWASSYAWRLT
jgi:hypothetical protein